MCVTTETMQYNQCFKNMVFKFKLSPYFLWLENALNNEHVLFIMKNSTRRDLYVKY